MIDFHSHLDLYPDPPRIVAECEKRGIYILSVTTTPSAWTGTSAIAASSKRIRTSLGLHPQLAHQRRVELELFSDLLPSVKYVGEVGLDGAPEYKGHWKDQMDVFRHVLRDCQRAGGRVISIHSRRAASQVLEELERFPSAGCAVFHWFSGSKRELSKALSAGHWFSVGLPMLNAEKGREIIRLLPKDRVLTETDGPFSQFNGRPALPWDVADAEVALAKLWGEGLLETQQRLESNLQELSSVANGT